MFVNHKMSDPAIRNVQQVRACHKTYPEKRLRVHHLCETEVDKFEDRRLRLIQHDVRRLEIAVGDAHSMEILEDLSHRRCST